MTAETHTGDGSLCEPANAGFIAFHTENRPLCDKPGIVMKRMIRAAAFAAILLLSVLSAGCGKEARHYQQVEKDAVLYYQAKYGGRETVADSFKAGNDGLFGYIGVKDRAYEMSDGFYVYWNDSEGYFADNRQAEEIRPSRP